MPWNKKERERERLKMCLRLMERAFVLAYERERERVNTIEIVKIFVNYL